ncbi:type II toxin-antitoxin system VapC family toxin [Microbacterium aoyamense]|uniref:Ribonuclease VapC n=1 Tax=Microbacterium aoyamense TaxID=344166 RepID=A0ABN2PDC7_9MICO|nr:type II toxin-antitoxin system VapC family toxin [Microbacterium aoyamense]
MIVDSSALIALLQGEPTAEAIRSALKESESAAISAATLVEASIVADGTRDAVRSSRFDVMIDELSLQVVALTAEQARIARQAYRDYGRGSGHAANLNFGDCFSYALAAERREPLLYVGDDFGHTDIRSALAD